MDAEGGGWATAPGTVEVAELGVNTIVAAFSHGQASWLYDRDSSVDISMDIFRDCHLRERYHNTTEFSKK